MSTKTKKPLKSTVMKPGDYYVNFVNKINGIRHSETGIKAKKKALDLVEEKSNSDAKEHAHAYKKTKDGEKDISLANTAPKRP